MEISHFDQNGPQYLSALLRFSRQGNVKKIKSVPWNRDR